MNDNQMLIAVLAVAAFAVVVLFKRNDTADAPMPTVLDVGESQTEETTYGPEYLTFNQPYAFGPPIAPFNPMPRTSVGEIGQFSCNGGC